MATSAVNKTRWLLRFTALVAGTVMLCSCDGKHVTTPLISFTRLPPATEGGPDKVDTIEGKVTGAHAGDKLVLFARSGVWWVQPLDTQPFTEIKADHSFKAIIHLGTEYAALLVKDGYQPPATVDDLPQVGDGVIASFKAAGSAPAPNSSRFVNFSGYQWEVRQTPSNRGGETTNYDPENVVVDASGLLHLRIRGTPGNWTCSEIHLGRSLGYGSYIFTVRGTEQLDPSVVLGMFTWDDTGVEQNHRELDVEVSQWGDATSKNAQFVIQPYYVPANVMRFSAPAGTLIHSFRWEPGQATFRTMRDTGEKLVSEHVFTSGVPAPGAEAVHMNLYYFGESGRLMPHDAEVIIEKFEFLP